MNQNSKQKSWSAQLEGKLGRRNAENALFLRTFSQPAASVFKLVLKHEVEQTTLLVPEQLLELC
jgi:hypothetical protein